MNDIILNVFVSQTDGINQSKVSEISPFLYIIARQNNLNLSKLSDLKKAILKLKLSIIFN
jgi:hypothetical protein